MQVAPAPDSSSARVVYVASGRLAAAQWEAHLARHALDAGRRVIGGLEVVPYRAFAADLWTACRQRGDAMLLTPRQSSALWRRVIEESSEGARLLGTAGTSRLAQEAWQQAASFRLDLDALRRYRHGADIAAFLRWSRAYSTRLTDSGWLDGPLLDISLVQAVPSGAPNVVALADLDLTPSRRAVLAWLDAAGIKIVEAATPVSHGRAATLRCADPSEELETAADWAARSIAAAPGKRFAIVVPELENRALEARRALRSALGVAAGPEAAENVYLAGARSSADRRPLLGAVLNALELLTPAGDFAALSRWLRSPFFHDEPTRAAAAALEAQLRAAPLAQVPFVDAYRRAGLRERMLAALPETAGRVDAALRALDTVGARCSPARWVSLWPRLLDALGWRGWPPELETDGIERRVYEHAALELASLTPIVGDLAAAGALAELEAGLRRNLPAMLPLAGVHLLTNIEDVGPGYAGAWIMGATDGSLPRPTRHNPFLPRAIQIDVGMPWSSPRDALERSRALVERIATRVPEVIFSWPERVHEEVAEPSPLIRDLATHRFGGKKAGYPVTCGAAGSTAEARRRELVADPAPALSSQVLRGGTAALNAQSTCPLRAFCEYRLEAKPLDAVERGVAAQLKGRVLHDALERLYRRFGGLAAIEAATGADLDEAIRSAAHAAAEHGIGRGHPMLDALVELESERTAALLAAFVEKERERAPFRVAALELEETVEIGGRLLRVRIDRLDALEPDGLAVIDYKTGAAPRPIDWLGSRPRDVQLPLYAAARPQLSALVIAVLRTERVGYTGIWEPLDALPGRTRNPLAEMPLRELTVLWRERIGALIDEYTAGDVRIFVADADAAAGVYAPLTRVYEQLVLGGRSLRDEP